MYGKNMGQYGQELHYSVGDTGLRLLFGVVILLGLLSYGVYFVENQDVSKSTYWPTVEGKLEDIGERSLGVPVIGRFLPLCYPYAKYSYTVDNKSYTNELTAGPCINVVRHFTFHPPERQEVSSDELMKKIDKEESLARATGQPRDFASHLERTMALIGAVSYKPIKVRYEREHPNKSVLDPTVLQNDKSQLYSSIILILLGSFLLGGSFYKSYLDSLGGSDPMLSVDTALAAQRRRR
jgi:hypothetical protein